MRRSKLLGLVGLALLVALFDVWFFFGGTSEAVVGAALGESDAAYDDAYEEREDDARTDDDSFDEEIADGGRAEPRDLELTEGLSLLVLQRFTRKNEPRKGCLDPLLMAHGPVPAAASLDGQPEDGHFPASVTAIFWHPEAPSALIDGRIVRPGELVLGHQVTRILPNAVVLAVPGGRGVERLVPIVAGARSAPDEEAATALEEEES